MDRFEMESNSAWFYVRIRSFIWVIFGSTDMAL